MREVMRLGELLADKLGEETATMLAERAMFLDVAAARSRELAAKRDEEFQRIDDWAEKQKQVVREVFSAMIAESELDIQKHDEAMRRLNGGAPAVSAGRASGSDKPRPRKGYAQAIK